MSERSPKASGCLLPVSRVKTIMKSSPDVSAISQDALYLIAKATELFVGHLAETSLSSSDDKQKVQYTTLAGIVDSDETLQFLQDIIPPKITMKKWKAITTQNVDSGDDEEDD